MAAVATRERAEARRVVVQVLRAHIACDHCGAHETPGLTSLTAWGLLCSFCRDDYECIHGAGEKEL